MKKEPIILVGGGGHCHSVIDVVECSGRFDILGIVDMKEQVGRKTLGYEVIGCDDDLEAIFTDCKNACITVGHIKSNATRLRLFRELKKIGYQLPTIVSPFAYVSKHSSVGEGTVVMHQAMININAAVGDNCIINTKSLIEHDVVIEDHCHISTASIVNGESRVMTNTFYGSNAVSRQTARISGFVKAGSVVR